MVSVKPDGDKHSIFLLYYHLTFVVKYHRKLIADKIKQKFRKIFEDIDKNYYVVEEWNFEKDHIHVLFRTRLSTYLIKFINAYKSSLSKLIEKEFPEVRNYLWGKYF